MRNVFQCRACDSNLEIIYVINGTGILQCRTCGTLQTGPDYRAVVVALQGLLATALKVDDRVWAEAVDRAGTTTPCDHALFALEGYTDWLDQCKNVVKEADTTFP